MFLTIYFFNKLCTLFYGARSWWWDTNNILFPFTLIILAMTWYVCIFINNSKKNQPPLPPAHAAYPWLESSHSLTLSSTRVSRASVRLTAQS
ncbi:hypothetical protein CsSME_00044811 [Camellia sinensis var. sinensis]